MADLTRVNKQFSVLYGKEDDILASKNKIRDKFDLGDIPFSQYADNITAGGGSAEYFKCVAVGEKVEEGGNGGSTDRQYTDYYYMEFTPSQDAIDDGITIVEDVTGLYWGNLAESKVLTNAHGSTIYLNDEGYQWQVRSQSRGDMYFWNWVDSGDPGWGSTEKPGTKFTGNVGAAIGDEHETVFYTLSVATDEQINAGSSAGDSSSSGNSTDIIVSGGTGNYEELNGTYKLDDPTATGLNRYWKHSADNKWQIYCTDMLGTWEFRKGDKASGSVSVVGPAYWGDENSQPIGRDWIPSNEIEGDCTIYTEWASAEPELAPNTWNGQKAILLTDEETGKPYYDFEKTVTEGLPFGNGFTPVVDGIYDREALVKVSALVEKQGLGTVVAAVPTSGEATLNIYIESDAGGEIDWGDGSKTAITEGTMVAEHTYTTYKEYIVSINGEEVRRLCFRDPQYGNWTSRCVKRLISLGYSLTSMYKMFNEANGSLERIEDTCQIPESVTNMELAFKSVYSLTYAPASLRMPNGCSTFERAFYQCTGLVANATNWFDNFTEGGKNMVEAFQQTKITGTVPASKLWNSGWSWNGTAYCFSSCSNLSNYNDIPSNWK